MSQTSSSEPDPSAERRSELEKNLAEVRSRIAAACAAAGRDPGEITLIAITKTRPPADVLLLHELGLTDFGENKDQEAAPKAAACAAALADAGASAGAGAARSRPLRWHFVGQLQTNKASSVAGYADVVHSVDRVRLVRALGAAARKAGRELTCLVQVDLDTPADPARGGVPPGQVREIAEAIEAEQRPHTRRGDGHRPARRGPRAGVRSAASLLPRGAGGQPGGGDHFGRHERRPGGRHRKWRDTRANWYGVARSQKASRPVMSVA